MAKKTIDALTFGSDTHVFTLPYGSCSTAASTAAKTVSVQGNNFSLETGARVLVKFTVTNTAANPTLNVNSTGAKSIYYRGSAISASHLAANRTHEFVYNGTQWDLIGDVDSNTKNTTGTSEKTESILYLVGAQSQSDGGVVTYSNSNCYIDTDNCLYSNQKKVSVEGHTHSGYAASSHNHAASAITSGTISTDRLPAASGTSAGITIVYPAASCTSYTSDSGTTTPLAVQNAAKKFAITRPTSTATKVPRFTNTTGDVESTKVGIETVTNTRDTSKTANVLVIPAEGDKKMVYGYCTDQIDGTSFIGGVFPNSATEYPYTGGLAIGGSSGNLLWKGKQVATTDMITDTKVTSVANHYTPTGFTTLQSANTMSASWDSTCFLTGVEIDEAGHVTGLTSLKMPPNPNTDTTYTVATGDSNGQIKVTPSSGSAYNVSVKGLGTAAYTASTAYAAASHNQSASTITSGTLAIARGGTGVTSHTDTTYTTARYRASALTSSATNPTVNGVINWWYE